MSDSDDTDVLLLIPPDFFLVDESENDLNSTIVSLKDEILFDDEILNQKQNSNTNSYINSSIDIVSTDNELNSNISSKQQHYFFNMDVNKTTVCNSTPKFNRFGEHFSYNSSPKHGKVLKEIDNFLMENSNAYNSAFESNNISINAANTIKYNEPEQPNSKFNYSNGHQTLGGFPENDTNYSNNIEDPLISLNEIWGQNCATQSIQEERLRRQHCEKTIQVLQTKLLEYQQKISVAIKVDNTKDEALKKFHGIQLRQATTINQLEAENLKLNKKIEEHQNKSESTITELNQKIETLQNDIAQTLTMVKKFQERNETLELKIESLTLTSNEIRNINKTQIQDLEIRLSNSLQNEKILNDEICKMKIFLNKIETELNKEKNAHSSNKIELANMKKEIETNKMLQETINSLNAKEKNMTKELESQRISLKSYYQTQLENMVSKKLKEFQNQLDLVEENLKSETKQRERLIVERAIQQMKMINQKNEEEFSLITERHNEENSLYRIQLDNASKTIDSLKEKLEAYQTRRADIAERLHGVMETQWQKALEIITSPSNSNVLNRELKYFDTPDLNNGNNDKTSVQTKTNNEMYETPTSSFSHKSQNSKTYSDKLNAYIEILLKKSPRDLLLLEDIMRTPKTKIDNFCTTDNTNCKLKPPWR